MTPLVPIVANTMVIPPTWQITPVTVAAVMVGLIYQLGRMRLARRQCPAHRRSWWPRAGAFFAGLLLLILTVSGPAGRWAMQWFSIHMASHVIEMFFVPVLLVLGAPWVPFLHAVPVKTRRTVLIWWRWSPRAAGLRALSWVITRPLTAVVAFNGTMILWHIPRFYNWASWQAWPMDWIMTPMFVLSGYLFWRVVLGSHPFPPRGTTRQQVGAVVVTAFVMLVTAIALAVMARTPVYSMHVFMDGAAPALRDQRIAAGILWVCGDLWAIPALVLIAYRIYSGGRAATVFERAMGTV